MYLGISAFMVLTLGLLKIEVFWDITLFWLVNGH